MRAAVYATREQVKTALDSVESARNNRKIDRHIRGGSDAVEKLTLRRFYPMLATRSIDWPDEYNPSAPWSLWLGENELAAAPTQVTSGGTVLDIADVIPYPLNGPPYNELQLNLASSSAFSAGSTRQAAIGVTGPFASCRIAEVPGGDLAAAVADATTTTITIGPSAEVGVGSLIRVGTERMNVWGRSMVTTGQTLALPVDAVPSSKTLRVQSGAAFVEDETILLDSERMRIEDIAGNDLIVTRAWDGTPIASHTGSTIYAPRRLTVERGACGTTAAAHSNGDDILIFQPPDVINLYVIAFSVVSFLNESAGYARMTGSGDNERESAGRQLAALEQKVLRGFYRVRN